MRFRVLMQSSDSWGLTTALVNEDTWKEDSNISHYFSHRDDAEYIDYGWVDVEGENLHIISSEVFSSM